MISIPSNQIPQHLQEKKATSQYKIVDTEQSASTQTWEMLIFFNFQWLNLKILEVHLRGIKVWLKIMNPSHHW